MTLSPQPVHFRADDGTSLTAWDYGGSGPPLLLAHLTGGHGRIWEPLIKRLNGHFRFVAPDARGHGDSEAPGDADAYRWERLGLDLLAVIDHLELGSGLMAMGHSVGGAQVAHAEVARPGAFSRAFLIEPIIRPPDPGPGRSAMASVARRRVRVWESREAARRHYVACPPMNAWEPEALDAYLEHGFRDRDDGRVELKCDGAVEARFYEMAGQDFLYRRLDQLGFDALIAAGTRSPLADRVQRLREDFPRARFQFVDGAGHFAPQEQCAAIADLARGFFNGG